MGVAAFGLDILMRGEWGVKGYLVGWGGAIVKQSYELRMGARVSEAGCLGAYGHCSDTCNPLRFAGELHISIHLLGKA